LLRFFGFVNERSRQSIEDDNGHAHLY
jgi:hypothetical protein